jgi:drug/metabolite transporter (DMT)-like permease
MTGPFAASVLPDSALAAVLGGALLHAAWNVGIRGETDRRRATSLLLLGAAVVALAALPFLPAPRPAAYRYLAVSALLHVGYFNLVAEAYARGGLALVYPIMRGVAPLLTAMIAVFGLGEALGRAGWAGVALVAAGIGCQARLGRGEMGALAIALANAGIIALYTINDALGARASQAPAAYTLWIFLLTSLPSVALLNRGRPRMPDLAEAARGLAGGFCSIASYGLALWALTRAPIAPIAALRETAMIFGVLLAYLWLGERPGPRGWLAVALIAAGAMLLRLS